MAELDLAALRVRRRRLLDSLRITTAAALAARWTGLDAYTDDQLERWVAVSTPLVLAAQNRAIDTQTAYLSRILAQPLTINRRRLLETATIDLGQPFVALANALSSGAQFADAVLAGQLRAEGVGESAVTWAERAANTTADEKVTGWERVPSGGACEWCQVVATQRYRTAESASFGHLRCSCAVEPLLGERGAGRVVDREQLAELRASGAVERASASRARSRQS